MRNVYKYMPRLINALLISSILSVTFLFVSGPQAYNVVTLPLLKRTHTAMQVGPKPTRRQQGQILWNFSTRFHNNMVRQKTYGLFSGLFEASLRTVLSLATCLLVGVALS